MNINLLNNKYLIILFFIFVFINKLNAQDFSYHQSKDRVRFTAGFIYSNQSTRTSLDIQFSSIKPLRFFAFFDEDKREWKRKFIPKTGGYAVSQIGAEYDFTHQNFALRYSLFQTISPISFNPLQVIYNFGPSYKGFTYRPEIGLGFWIFQLNYGFNVNFRNELNQYGQHLVVFKVNLPY